MSHIILCTCLANQFLLINTSLLKLSVTLSICECCCHLVTKSCPTLATPWTVAQQALPSMGFSSISMGYWNGLPFPSPGDLPDPAIKPFPALASGFFTTEPQGKPICECAVLCLVTQLCQTLCDPINSGPQGSSVRGDSSGKEYWSGLPCPSPGHLPNPGIEFKSSTLQASSLPSETPVQFSHSVVSDSWRPHGLQHARPPCLSPTPGVYSNSCPLSWWCHPSISPSVVPFSSHLYMYTK